MFDILIKEIEGEPRMRDIDMAEALGFEHPRRIRSSITRHSNTLASFGDLAKIEVTANQGGSPYDEYWLNEKQALFICTKSEAKNALDITIQMIEVFSAWRHGQLADVNFPNIMVLLREARVTHGKKAAQRLWKRAGLPMPDVAEIKAEAAQSGEIGLFLREYCICTGDARRFTRSAELLEAYKHWCRAHERQPMTDATFTKRLSGLAGQYRDPATGEGFVKHKASVSGYLGLSVDAFALVD